LFGITVAEYSDSRPARKTHRFDAAASSPNNTIVRAIAPLLKTVVFTLFVPGIVAGYIPWRLRNDAAPAAHGIEAVISVAVIVVGILIYLHTAFWGFAWTGGGTPAPIAPTKRLVVRGLHRFVRNPMYIGVGMIIGGQAWLFHSRSTAIYLGVFAVFVNLFVLFYEEPTLKRQFGEDYERYRSSVPRWIPRIRSVRS
jgi:protein-S-isoprenylcysteine O-methyltransferase Ste14